MKRIGRAEEQRRWKSKLLTGILVLLVPHCAVACGNDEQPRSAEPEGYFARVSGGDWNHAPEVFPAEHAPPRKVVSRDIEVGDGPVAHIGDRVEIHYVGINYKTGETQYPGRWPPSEPLALELGSGDVAVAYEEALAGMRVGGRREVIVPSGLLFRTGTIDYIVDLVRLDPDPQAKHRAG